MNLSHVSRSFCLQAFLSLSLTFPVLAQVSPSVAPPPYTVTWTELTPPDATTGTAWAVGAGIQGGAVKFPAYPYNHAGIWHGTAGSWLDLNPSGAIISGIYALAGSQQGGYAQFATGGSHAGIWAGTAGSFTDLHPAGASSSYVYATTGTRQAGYADFSNGNYLFHAGTWTGTAGSFVDLHPAGAYISYAYATTATRQGGSASFAASGYSDHAALWSGTAASFVDLNPAGALSSVISAMAGDRQAGGATFSGGSLHAGTWAGTATSFVDLHPAGALSSFAAATTGDAQAGSALFGDLYHPQQRAYLWFGSANTAIDLQASLGAGYTASAAEAMWSDGSTISVGGFALNSQGYPVPMLWTAVPVPEPSTAALALLAVTALLVRRSKLLAGF